MTLTKQQAIMADEFHHGNCTVHIGPKGGVTTKCTRVRRNGRTQTWVTRPTEWRIPVKYGIRAKDQFSIHHYDAGLWHTADECPLKHTYDVYVSAECVTSGVSHDADACPVALAIKQRVPHCTSAFVAPRHSHQPYPSDANGWPDISVHAQDSDGTLRTWHADVDDATRQRIQAFDRGEAMQPFWFVLTLQEVPF